MKLPESIKEVPVSEMDIGVERELELSDRVAARLDVEAFKRAAVSDGMEIIEFLVRQGEELDYHKVASDVLNGANAELSMVDFAAILERLGNGQSEPVIRLIEGWLREAHTAT